MTETRVLPGPGRLRCRLLPLLAAVTAACAGDPAITQGPPAANAAAAEQEESGERLEFDVRDVPFDRVLDQYVRKAATREILVPPEVRDRPVTLRVRNFPWKSALEELALRIDCGVREDGGVLRIVMWSPEELEERRVVAPPWPWQWAPRSAGPGTVTVDIRDQPLDAALNPVRAASEATIIVSRELYEAGCRLTVRFLDVPWQQALLTIAGQVDGIVREIRDGVLRVEASQPHPRIVLSRAFWSCDREGQRYRGAQKSGDSAGMADAGRAYRAAAAELDRAVREFPDWARTGGVEDAAFSAPNLEVLQRILRRVNGDVLAAK